MVGGLETMKVLILGGTGEISYFTLKQFVDNRDQVIAINRGQHPQYEDKKADYRKADVNNREELIQAIGQDKFDVVIDFTSFYPQDLLVKLEILTPVCNQYVFISSIAVYNKREDIEYTEDMEIFNSRWDYGLKKSRCEEVLTDFFLDRITRKCSYIIIRPGCTYGIKFIPYSPIETAGMPGILTELIRTRREVFTWGDGEKKISLMYAGDFATALYELLNNDNIQNQIFNVVGRETKSLNEILSMIAEVVGEKERHFRLTDEEVLNNSFFADYTGSFSNKRLFGKEGVLPQFKYTTSIEDMMPGLIESGDKTNRGVLKWQIQRIDKVAYKLAQERKYLENNSYKMTLEVMKKIFRWETIENFDGCIDEYIKWDDNHKDQLTEYMNSRYGIYILQEDINNIETVSDLLEMIRGKLAWHIGLERGIRMISYKKRFQDKEYENRRNEEKFRLLSQWIRLKNHNIYLKKFFEYQNISTIAIYGMGDIGKLLYDELKATEYNHIVKYGLDSKIEGEYDGLTICSLTSDNEPVDSIIITPVLITDEIENRIYEVLGDKTTYTFEEILFELTRIHGLDLSMWRL